MTITYSSWPLGDFIYIGSKNTLLTPSAPDLSVKNFIFLKYWMSKVENIYIPFSEYYYRRGSLFYFSMNEGRLSGISNGFTPESEKVSLYGSRFLW